MLALAFVHFALAQDFQGFLFQGVFAGAVAHLGHFLLVGGEFIVDFGDFDVDGVDAGVDLGTVRGKVRMGETVGTRTPSIAWFRVGLGAVFLAPKRRFMMENGQRVLLELVIRSEWLLG